MFIFKNLKQWRKERHFILTSILIASVSIILTLSVAFESFLVVSDSLSKVDAIVVMAGGHKVRLPPVAKLYKEGAAPLILLTNDGIIASWSQKYQRNLYQVEWAKEDLVEMGVSNESIILLDYTASGTIHDALNTLQYVRAHPEIRSLLVVTSDYHTRRTLWTFRHVFKESGLQIGCYPVSGPSEQWWRRAYAYYIEFTKYVCYRLRY